MNSLNRYTVTLLIVTFGLWLVALGHALYWVTVDKTPAHWDFANHVLHSFDYLELIHRHQYRDILLTWKYYPPLTYIIFAIIIRFWGYSSINVVFFNLSLILITSVIVYFYSRLFSNRNSSLFATLVAMAYLTQTQFTYLKIWQFMLEYPLALILLVTFFAYFYFFKNELYSIKSAIILGLLCAISMLIKWSSVFFLFPIPIFYAASVIRRGKFQILIGLTISFLLISGPWYLSNANNLINSWKYYNVLNGLRSGIPQGWPSIFFYIKSLYSTIGWFLAIFLLPAAITFYGLVRDKLSPSETTASNRLSTALLQEIILISFPFFTISLLVLVRDTRYLYPLYLYLLVVLARKLADHSTPRILILTSGIILIVIFFNYIQSKPSLDNSPLDEVTHAISNYHPTTVGYFFEQNTARFNPPNILLLHRLKEYQNSPFPQPVILNDVMLETKIYSCDTAQAPDLIAVYSAHFGFIPTGRTLSFLNQCPAEFTKHYTLADKKTFKEGDSLTIYTHLP